MQSANPRRWTALAVIALAQFIIIMDTSIIGVALPEIQTDLGFTPENLSWVFNAYVIALGGLLLLGGRLSDLLGAKKVFTAGWVVLAGASLAAGLAGSVEVEIAARAAQGAGAALIAPSALTLLMMLFGSNPKELMKAFAVYGAAAPAGGTAGVFLGGVITEWISWPWVFYINIPIALLVLAVTPGLMPSAPARRGSIDFAGAITATAGLALTVFGVVRAPEEGWGSATTLLTIAGGLALLALFVAIQATRREPLVRLGIFRTPNLAAANLAQVLLGAAWIPMWFFLNLYLQQVLGYGAFEGGAALLPMTAAIMLGMVVVAPKVIARLGRQGPDGHRPAAPRHGHGDPVAGAAGRLVRRRRPPRVADRRRRDVAGLHPDARHGDPVRQAGGGRPRLGDRQHQLPGRLRARPGGDDRTGQRLRRRPARRPRRPHRRLLRRVPRRGRDRGHRRARRGRRFCARPGPRRPRRPASNRTPACRCERSCAGGPSRPPAHGAPTKSSRLNRNPSSAGRR